MTRSFRFPQGPDLFFYLDSLAALLSNQLQSVHPDNSVFASYCFFLESARKLYILDLSGTTYCIVLFTKYNCFMLCPLPQLAFNNLALLLPLQAQQLPQ